MTVKEVIALAADNLGREDLAESLSSLTGEPEGELKALVRCYNLVENEVALDYCPLKAEEKLTPIDGKVAFSALSHAPVDVYSVKNALGATVAFEIYPAYLSLPAGTEQVMVSYAYAPAAKTAEQTCEVSEKVSARLLSFGVACEFSLSCARYQEAALWDKRFRDALRAAEVYRRRPSARLGIRARRWV